MRVLRVELGVAVAVLVGLQMPEGPQSVLAQSATNAAACSVAALQSMAPQGTSITAANMVDVTPKLPRYCRVDGHVATPGNTVNFRLGLPEGWNGKYYFQGIGGLGGTIGSLDTGLARGYASASTDTGHDAKEPDWGANRAKEIDYGHRGTHVTAVAAKTLTAAYYSRKPDHAYFNGCSNGGRQALMEVQRYADDFDGVIAGDPATGTPMQVGRGLVYQTLLASPENYLSKEKVDLIARSTLAACDAKDGLQDGLISDPRPCDFKPESLKCSGAETAACLTEGQLASVKKIYGGVKDPSGRIYAPPFPFGHEDGPSGWQGWITGLEPPTRRADGRLALTNRPPSGFALAESNFRFLSLDEDNPNYTWWDFKFPEDLSRLKTMTDILSPLDADIRPFKNAGGKLIMYHGWADPGISAYGTLDYHERLVETVGGQKVADEFVRTYFVPGMHHCSGGPGPNTFDMLPVLEAWVERGVPPTRVVASHATNGTVDRTRPLCPHPQVARYSGTGSIDDAANFSCQLPEPRR